MNHATLRKIAAATAVICDELGGSADMFFLLKAAYLADRQMVLDYGVPITGDRYSSMPKGPILSGLYNLLKRNPAFGDKKTQAEWDAAFQMKGDAVSRRPGAVVDTDCLAPIEEDILREKIIFVIGLHNSGVNVAKWMHENCPEWEEVPKGSSKPLPMERLLECAKKIDTGSAKKISGMISDAIATRQMSLTAKLPILVKA